MNTYLHMCIYIYLYTYVYTYVNVCTYYITPSYPPDAQRPKKNQEHLDHDSHLPDTLPRS